MYHNQEDFRLKCGKLLGQPLNPQLPIPVELSTIANIETAEPGEHVWRMENVDLTADVVLVVDSNGLITVKKRTPLTDVLVEFTGVNSKLEYVLVEDVLNKVDTRALSRRKASITRSMDKREVKIILDALITPSSTYFPANKVENNEVTVASGDDLYDVIVAMKHKLEDYGDNFALLVGKTVKEKLDVYDKEQASVFNYNVEIMAKLKSLNIDVMKIFGKVSLADNEVETDLLDPKKMVMVARNSRIQDGKPITFVRRKVTPEIAQAMGVEVDEAQRCILMHPMPIQDSGNRLAYGVYGYESAVFCITNPYGISFADATIIL